MDDTKSKSGRKSGKTVKRTVKKTFLMFFVIVIFGAGCFLFGKFGAGIEDRQELTTVVIENQLEEISELSTLSYHYKDFGKFSDAKIFNDIKIPFTTSEFIVSFEGDIKAGIKMSGIEVKKTAGGFLVTLPDAEIFSHEIHTDTAKVLDEKTSMFNPVKVSDYNGFYNSQKDRIEKEALDRGLLENARESGVKLVKNILSEFETEEIKIDVK